MEFCQPGENCFVDYEVKIMEHWSGLPSEVETIAESLSASGYRTAMAGGQNPH